jgi:hypothetical protein
MERIMSQDSTFQATAPMPAESRAPLNLARWMVPVLVVTAIAVVFSLAGCGPNAGSNAASDQAAAGPSAVEPVSATPSAAAAAAATAAQSQAQAAAPAACPKLVAPRCPSVPAATPTASAQSSTVRPEASNRLATSASDADQRLWSRHHHAARHGGAFAMRERRAWDHGRPWPGDRVDRDRTNHDQFAREHDDRGGLMGGASGALYSEHFARVGVRESEETRETSRSEAWRSAGGEHVVVRQGDHGALRPCPERCRPAGYRTFDYAGIDGRGYLVWPGKVEY